MKNLPKNLHIIFEKVKSEIAAEFATKNKYDLLEHFFNTNHLEYKEPNDIEEFFDLLGGMGLLKIEKRWRQYVANK